MGFGTMCAIVLGTLAGCTRSSIPIANVTALATETQSAIEEPPQPTFVPFEASSTYGVAWVPADQELEVHNPAGVAGSVVDRLGYAAHRLQLTGNSTSLGSSLWVEISYEDVARGWVNFWNLTEDVSHDAFCSDARAYELAGAAVASILDQDGEALAALVNPQRGLIIRQEWWNPEVAFSREQVRTIFQDQQAFDWGEQSGGGFRVNGSFPGLVVPLLQDVLQAGEVPACNMIQSGVSTTPAEWPSEYTNLQYFTYFRPAPEKGNRYDWRAWALGFEYIRGEPFLTLLIHYHGDI